jgi:putative flavoprotein involved in K+ transport
VVEVYPGSWSFEVRTTDGGMLEARSVVAASGGFGLPYRPGLPGLEGFDGEVLHSAE